MARRLAKLAGTHIQYVYAKVKSSQANSEREFYNGAEFGLLFATLAQAKRTGRALINFHARRFYALVLKELDPSLSSARAQPLSYVATRVTGFTKYKWPTASDIKLSTNRPLLGLSATCRAFDARSSLDKRFERMIGHTAIPGQLPVQLADLGRCDPRCEARNRHSVVVRERVLRSNDGPPPFVEQPPNAAALLFLDLHSLLAARIAHRAVPAVLGDGHVVPKPLAQQLGLARLGA
jgi:hypothetical protein